MIKIEVKYRDKPLILNKKTGKIIEHRKKYNIKTDEGGDSWVVAMQNELVIIMERYKGVYSIRFYI